MVDNIHYIKKQLQSVGDSDFNDILASGINVNLPDSISYDMNFQNSNQLNNDFGYYLYGTELKKFLKDNNVPNESYVLVYKDMVTINEVNFPIYKVYDREDSQESTFQYEEYVKKCLYYESKIDEAVLDKLAKGGTSLVFEQTYRCDGGSLIKGHFNAAAYCNSLNRNVVQFFNPYSFEYNARAIVHETGHAYDFTIRNNLIGDYGCGITALNNDNLVNTKLSNEQISDLFLVDSNGNSLTWDKIIKNEVNCFDSTMDYTRPCIIDRFKTQEEAQKFFENKCLGGSMVSLSQQEDKWILKVAYTNPKDELGLGVTVNNSSSLYNVHDYVSSPHEYFADSFAAYYIGDDKARFEYLCPETYKTLDRIIKKDINDYKNGGRL